MAMPPDGSSAWFHHSDSYVLPASDGSAWALVSSEVAAPRLTLSFAILNSPGSFFTCLQLEGTGANVQWTLHHESLDQPRTVAWREDSDPETLIATGIVRAREHAWKGDGSEPVFATMEVDGSLVRVCDSAGKTRVELSLASAAPDGDADCVVVTVPRTGVPLFAATLYGSIASAPTSLP